MRDLKTNAQRDTYNKLHIVVLRYNVVYLHKKDKVEALKIINDTCNCIKSLQKDVKNAGERLSQLLDYVETNGLDEDILTNLLQQ